MTCICGHHEKAHLSDIGLCAAPEGCNCNHFHELAPNEEPYLIDNSKATQDAEWLAGSEADTAERNLARAYLAMCDEVAGFEAMWEAREQAHDAEIAEAKRQLDEARQREGEWATLYRKTRARLAEAQQEATAARVSTAQIVAMAEVRDVGREEGIRYALSAALAEARKDSERLDWLDTEEQRVDRVLAISVKRNLNRNSGEWAEAFGPVRETIDRARTPQPETPE